MLPPAEMNPTSMPWLLTESILFSLLGFVCG